MVRPNKQDALHKLERAHAVLALEVTSDGSSAGVAAAGNLEKDLWTRARFGSASGSSLSLAEAAILGEGQPDCQSTCS